MPGASRPARPPPASRRERPAAIVHLNGASADELDALDGIGPSLAERIVAYRVAHGGFRSVDELDEVSGIGPVRLDALRAAAGAVTRSAGIDDLGVAAAPWLAVGLALPGAGRVGRDRPRARRARAARPARTRAADCAVPVAVVGLACALAGAAWSAHGVAARAADPLRALVGHVERARARRSTGSRVPGRSAARRSRDSHGHPVELRARGALQQGAIVEVSGSARARAAVRRRLRPAHVARAPGRARDARGAFDRRASAGAAASRACSTGCAAGARAALAAGGDDRVERASRRAWRWAAPATLDDDTLEAFRASGLAHLLAVSGGNIVLLVAAVLGLAWVAGMPRALAHGCAIPAVVAYAAIVGGGPSVVRAAATGVLVSLAWLIGSARDPWHLLALAAAAVLALDPWAVTGPGFQLSFAAVAAIHGLAPRHPQPWLEGTPVPLRLCSPLAISLACTARHRSGRARALRPHVARRQPAREPARAARRGAAAVARARGLRPLAGRARGDGRARRRHPRSRRLHRPRRAPRRVARRRAARGARCSSPCVGGGTGAGSRCGRRAASLAGGLAGLLLGARLAVGARVAPAPARAARHVPRRRPGRRGADRGARACARSSTRGRPAARVERLLRRRGVTSLDALLLSHDELDHDGRAGGDPALACASACSSRRRSRARARACATRSPRRASAGTRVVSGRAGLVLRSGPVELRVVGPRHATRGDAAERRRARRPGAAGTRARSCCPPTPSRRSLLGDDLAPVGRARGLAPRLGRPAPRRLLDALRPRLAVISVGAHNAYGHPSPATLAALARAGVPVRRTDREGDIALACRAGAGDADTITAMSAAPLDPVYLIGGSDRPKVELAIRRLRARVRAEDGSVEEFTARRHDDDGEGMSGEEAAGACNALGLFGGTRLLVVQGAEVWGDEKKARRRPRCARRVPPRARARRRARAADRGRGARRAPAHARRGRRAPCSPTTCPASEGQREWLRKQAARAGADLDGSALTRLLELAGDDTQALASEVEKLGLWSRGETITAERVDELCVLTADTPPWDLTDALGDRRPADALRVLGRLLDGPDGDVPRWVPSIARHLRQLAVAQHVREQGGGPKDIARELGLRSEFVARKLSRQSARWTREQLSAAIVRIAMVERETRGEGVLRDRFALERALTEAVGPGAELADRRARAWS